MSVQARAGNRATSSPNDERRETRLFAGFRPLLPGLGLVLVLGLVAQFRVKSAFAKYSQIRSASGMTGADIAKHATNPSPTHATPNGSNGSAPHLIAATGTMLAGGAGHSADD